MFTIFLGDQNPGPAYDSSCRCFVKTLISSAGLVGCWNVSSVAQLVIWTPTDRGDISTTN